MTYSIPESYELVKQETLKELNSEAYILRHKKSGARLFLLSNDDENKVFTIGFRTPPEDSTGLPHILEHCVLCGSDKYPVKDPFVELVKGSLNTFLNAMTYPDKTVYPVASCNDKDFQNLMDVYLDAVFHPNIYQNKMIFQQEGWHYELESEDAPLKINGVVYNEMKGAFSSPESVLERFTDRLLFPDTPYCFESGGDPDDIPNLTYEQFLAFHSRYYHPSNSYIYLYGNMDMEEKLRYLDECCLSHYDSIEVDSAIAMQKPFDRMAEAVISYPITDEEPEENATYLSLNMVTGTDLDRTLYIAFQILEYALLGAPGAPLKQAVLDAGIGKDVYGGYENGMLQPYFNITAKNTEASRKEEFVTVVDQTLRRLAKEGLNRKSLLAGINYFEFKYREADFGSYPKGLMYGLQCFDSWLYDDTDPMMHLKYEDTFAMLKEKADQGYFEELIRQYLLDNPHSALIAAVPEKGLQAKKDAALSGQLADYKAGLSPETIKQLVKETKALKEYQEIPSPQSDLEKIPMLKREDIRREAEPLYNDEREIGGLKVLHHNMFTSGIGYLRLIFDTKNLDEEDLLYLGLLKSVLGYVNTENYTYQDLFDEINIHTGGIVTGVSVYADSKDPDAFTGTFEVHAKALYDKIGFALQMVREILCSSKLDDEKRLYEIIAQMKSRSQVRLNQASHSAAVLRATAYDSPSAYFSDLTGGIALYQFIEELESHFDERKEEMVRSMQDVISRLFTPDNLMVSYTADDDGYRSLIEPLRDFKKSLCGCLEEKDKGQEIPYHLCRRNEGFKTSSQVQYVARTGNFVRAGYSYTGALKILKVILNYDYLWINLRVKGGAYGCMSGFSRNGESYFVSYRDPNLAETDRVYEGIPEYLRGFTVEERDMTKYIIGTVSDMDIPKNPAAKGARSLAAYMTNVSYEMLQRERDQVLGAGQEDIRALAGLTAAVLDDGNLCVIGNDGKIEESRELFTEVKNLFR